MLQLLTLILQLMGKEGFHHTPVLGFWGSVFVSPLGLWPPL